MAINLPNTQQPFVDPATGLVNRTWYLALLSLNNQVQAQVVTSVNISGNNGIQATGGPITSSGVFSLFIGNLTCTNVFTTGTVTAANAAIAGTVTSANVRTGSLIATATVTAADIVATASALAANIRATATVTAANAVVTGTVTSANVALSGSLKLGNAFAAGVTTAAGTLIILDSTGTQYRVLVTNL